MAEEEKEEIYETTVQVLNLGYSVEDARERLGNLVVINDVIEEPVKSDWSHLKEPRRQHLIDKVTTEIKRKERRR